MTTTPTAVEVADTVGRAALIDYHATRGRQLRAEVEAEKLAHRMPDLVDLVGRLDRLRADTHPTHRDWPLVVRRYDEAVADMRSVGARIRAHVDECDSHYRACPPEVVRTALAAVATFDSIEAIR